MLIPEWLAWALTPLPLLLPLAVVAVLAVSGRRTLRKQADEEQAEAERFDAELRALIDQEGKR